MTVPQRWALLCGGDHYIPSGCRDTGDHRILYKPLKGCVNDVKIVKDLLCGAGVPEDHIFTLTASKPEGNDRERPKEPENLWPTKKNINQVLDRISTLAQRGDLVLFHFSGHGIRRDRLPEVTHGTKGDALMGAALVMTDVMIGGPYLTGCQLGVRMQKFIDSGLRVTVVLDSCFSGGGYRNDNLPDPDMTPRTIFFNDDQTHFHDNIVADRAEE